MLSLLWGIPKAPGTGKRDPQYKYKCPSFSAKHNVYIPFGFICFPSCNFCIYPPKKNKKEGQAKEMHLNVELCLLIDFLLRVEL